MPCSLLRPFVLLVPLAAFACISDDAPPTGSDATESGDGDGDSGDGDGDSGDGDGDGDSGDGDPGLLVGASGDAFAFGPYTMIAGAKVSILQLPDFQTTTDADGHFAFEGLPAGHNATFVFEQIGYPKVHTKTFTLPTALDVERITFQVPDDATFAALATIVGIDPDPATCQIASTVTRVGKSIYDGGAHGEAGATVEISPSLPAEHGPIYFNSNVIPQKDLTETSDDGGVLYVNVPPDVYTITAHKDGVEFEPIVVTCLPGVLVNASPPHGLQAL